MRLNHAAIPILLGTCLLSSSPVLAASPSQGAVASSSVHAELKGLPSTGVHIIEAAIDFFDMGDAKLHASQIGTSEWRVTVERPADYGGAKLPSSLTLVIGAKDGKLQRLDANGYSNNSKQTAGISDAVEEARDFASRLLGKNVSVGINPQPFYGGMIVPIYPLVNEIPLQKEIAAVHVDASGNIRSFQAKDSRVDKSSLPSATDLLSATKAKQLFGDQLKMKLVYDDEHGVYQYVVNPLAWIDAKTGQAPALPYQIAEEVYTVSASAVHKNGASAEQVKQLADEFLGLQKEKLIAKSVRHSAPGVPATVLHTLEENGRRVTVELREESGSLLRISTENGAGAENASLATREEAKKQALLFIVNHLALPKGTYMLQERFPAGDVPSKNLPAEYQLSVFPVIEKIQAAKPLITVTIGLHGNIISAVDTRTYSPGNLAAGSLISEEQAKKALLDDLNIELNYVLDGNNGRATLVYVPSYDLAGRYVDAASSKLGWKTGW